jgi:hypothetical protein
MLGDPDQILIVYTTEPGSADETSLRLLANWHEERAVDDRNLMLTRCSGRARGTASFAMREGEHLIIGSESCCT